MTDASRRGGELPGWRRVSPGGVLLVALSAALWGTDALFRRGLALELPAVTVVFLEHVLLVIMMAPLLVRGLRRAIPVFTPRQWASVAVVGAGASATATVLFTMAFQRGDPTTPLLLQKLQPLFVVVAARLILGERPRRAYPPLFAVAITGAYLVAFPDPLAIAGPALASAVFAVGAALLWGLGTVLGRGLTAVVPPAELAALRFGFGLPAAGLLLVVTGATSSLAGVGGRDWTALVLLSAVPGLAALVLYYKGLRRTPASAATLAELAFPASALLVNYIAFGATLTWSQWLGLVVLIGAITLLSVAAGRRPATGGIVRVSAPQWVLGAVRRPEALE